MVSSLIACRAAKQSHEERNNLSSERYRNVCKELALAEERVGEDWDGVTILQDNKNVERPLELPDYIGKTIGHGDINTVIRWINANRSEDRANAVTSADTMCMPALMVASINGHLAMMTLLLQRERTLTIGLAMVAQHLV